MGTRDTGKNIGKDSMGRVLPLLVVVLLVFSVMSTYFILAMSPPVAPATNAGKSSGEIRLTVLPRENSQPDLNKGVVSLTILPG